MLKKGSRLSEEAKANMAAAHIGLRHSPETKAKIGQTQKGKRKKPLSAEIRKKFSESHKGVPIPDATREAVSKHKNIKGRKVIISGVEYKSMADAAKVLGIRYQEIVGMCRKFPERALEYGLTIDWVEDK